MAPRTTRGQASFQRGNTNGDGELNITDPVGLLEFLFSGTFVRGGAGTGNSDDHGTLSLTDAVHTLGFLLLGTAPTARIFQNFF